MPEPWTGIPSIIEGLYLFTMGLRRNTMNVGIVTTHISPDKGCGGMSVPVGVLTKAWAERGRQVVVVAADASNAGRLRPEDVQLGDGVEVRLYRCHGFHRWGFGFGAIPEIFKLCLQAPVVYIHGIATWPSTLAAVFCTLLRRPFMVAVQGGLMPGHVDLIRRRKPHKWLYCQWLVLPTLRRAIAVHCTSDIEARGVRSVLGEDARVLLVPNGIDSRHIQAAQYPAGAGLRLCFPGQIQREKGINAFVRAWLKVRRPEDSLVVAGHGVDGPYFEEFQALARQAQGAVSYRGYLERGEVMELLASSHFLVLPSGLEKADGMRGNVGNVVAEALAAGRPVLVAKGLAWDHLQALGAGFVFDRTEASLRGVLRKAQALDALAWGRMAWNGRRHVEQQLNPAKLGEQVWDALTRPVHVGTGQQLAEESFHD
jgi:glycosyltransferase involved in cell wall biosynthesis